MRRFFCCIFIFAFLINVLTACNQKEMQEETQSENLTDTITAAQFTGSTTFTESTTETSEKIDATITTAQKTTTQTTSNTTNSNTTTQRTEQNIQIEFCIVCGIGYDATTLVYGVCERCQNGECSMCGGPDGPNHNCDDYPNVICRNPDCDWGIYTSGIGTEGIVCPKCGTRYI